MYFIKYTLLVILYVIVFNMQLMRAAEDEDGYHTYTKEEYPNPLDPRDAPDCGRSRPSQFCAQRLLKAKQATQIDEIIRKIGNDTGCICEKGCADDQNGLSVGVALLNSAEKYSSNYLFEYADYLRTKWKLGSCENGILVLIIVKKGLITVSLGENAYRAIGSASKLFDDINTRESDNIKSETKLYNALQSLLESYYEKLKSLNLNQESAKRWTPNLLLVASALGSFLILICLIGVIYRIVTRKRRKTAQVNKSIEDIEKEVNSSLCSETSIGENHENENEPHSSGYSETSSAAEEEQL